MIEYKINNDSIDLKLNSINQNLSFKTNNKSLLNKSKFMLEDLKSLSEQDSSFEQFFLDFYNHIMEETFIFHEKEIIKRLDTYLDTLIKLRVPNVNDFCNETKKTKNSIFFDVNEMWDVLRLITTFKIIGLFIHSDIKETKSTTIQDVLNVIAEKYEHVNKKLFQVITSKSLRGNMTNKKYMVFLKYTITYDYLILYNFSFITTVLICTYNWKTNPISFIVSAAAENFTYLIMTYSNVPLVYSTDELNLEVSSGDFLDSISYEMILHNLAEKIQKDVTINDLYITPITQVIVLPLISYISDIPIEYLDAKGSYYKLQYQYLISKFIKKISKKYNLQYINSATELFNYGFEIPIDFGESILPMMLEVLKEEFTYYNLENKTPVLNAAKTFSVFVHKRKHLRNILTKQAISDDLNKNINEVLKDLAKFIVFMVSDEYREKFRKDLKIQFINYLGDVKLNKMMLGLLM